MDILKEQLNRTKELMGILNEQETPEKDRCVDLWYKWSDMVDELIKMETNSVGDGTADSKEWKEAKEICWCMNKYGEFQRNRFSEKMERVLRNLGLDVTTCEGDPTPKLSELEEIVVYDETQEQVDGEGIQGLDEDGDIKEQDVKWWEGKDESQMLDDLETGAKMLQDFVSQIRDGVNTEKELDDILEYIEYHITQYNTIDGVG